MRLRLTIAFAALVMFAQVSPMEAQSPGYLTSSNETGFPEYGSFIVSQIDSVNLSNGGVSIRIPVVARKGRGLDYSFGYRYESKMWVVDSYVAQDPWQLPILRFIWRPNESWGSTINLERWAVGWTEQIYQCQPYSQYNGTVLIKSNWSATAPDGTQYQFPVIKPYPLYPQNPCTEYDVQQLKAHSNTGHLEIDITNDGGSNPSVWNAKLRAKDGSFPGAWGTAYQTKDANGNWCCGLQDGWWTDTLGRKVGANSFYDSDGQVRTVQVEWVNLTLSTSFPTASPYPTHCSFDQAISGSSVSSVKKITLPNGLSYEFFYETWWDTGNPTAQNPYGEVTKVRLPTGGYIKYKWATVAEMDWGPEGAPNFIDCTPMLDSRVLVERRVSEDGANEQTWQYAYDTQAGTTTVTDPLGNVEIHTFSTGKIRLETRVEYRQGSSTPLRRVETTWASDNGPIFARQYSPGQEGFGLFGIFDVDARNYRTIRRTTTLLDTNQVSKTETDYDCFTYSIINTNFTDCRDNPTQIREYAFGSGSFGPLVRYTTFTYLHNVNSTYLNAHIWDRVKERKVYDAGGNLNAQSRFSYDTTTITATSGVPQHDYTGYPSSYSVRGNLTLVEKWRNTDGAWLATTNYFNDVGNLIQTTDPGGHTTTFSYADNYSDGINRNSQGYVTQVTYPTTSGVSHIERKQYFWFTGFTAAQCGQNFPAGSACANTYSPPQPDYAKFTYDLLGRPLTVVQSDGGQTTLTFTEPATPSPSNPITVSFSTKIDSTQNLVNTAVVDGLGRVRQTQLNSDPCGVDYVDTTYDALGHKSTVSNPYRITDNCSTGTSTNGTTTFNYDALGRVTQVIAADGGSVLSAYCGNVTKVTDQAGKWRRSITDAQGRLLEVHEPNSPTASVSACPSGGDPIAVTSYSYDVLDNLLTVLQSSSRQRTFVYNSLSQLTSATNPESGSICYGTVVGGQCQSNGYDADGDLVTRTDARSITTTHSYDALHRLTGKTYSNGDAAAAFTYDLSSIDGLSIQYPVGRMVKAAQGSTRTVSSFDVSGRVLNQWQCTPLNCGSEWFNLTYAFNYVGGATSFTDGVGNTYTQTFNTAAQITQLTSSLNDAQHPGTLASNFSYNAPGAVAQMMFGNGVYGRVDMNNRLQPCRMRTNAASMSAVDCAATDPTGDILQFKYGFSASGANNGNVMSWNASGSAGQSFTRSYTYDELNRLKTMSSTGATCTALEWTYDIWGNRTNQNLGQGGAACGTHHPTINTLNRISELGYDSAGNVTQDGSTTYQYDAENRMVSINNGCPSTTCYVYDAAGRRVRKITSGTTTEYIYGLGGNVVTEKVGTTWTVGYVYIGGQLIAHYSNSTTYFVHKDHLGSTRVMTKVDKTVQEVNDYLPYGETSVPVTTTHKFTGKERDTESGLDFFGARYYVSLNGRFLSPDIPFIDQRPVGPQSWNLYHYARNNPLRFIDPTGNSVEMVNGQHTKYVLDGFELFGDMVGLLENREAFEQEPQLRRGGPSLKARITKTSFWLGPIQVGEMLTVQIMLDDISPGTLDIGVSLVEPNSEQKVKKGEALLRNASFGYADVAIEPKDTGEKVNTRESGSPRSGVLTLELVIQSTKEGRFTGAASLQIQLTDSKNRRWSEAIDVNVRAGSQERYSDLEKKGEKALALKPKLQIQIPR